MPEKRCESEFAFRAGVHVCSSPPFRPFEGGCGAVEGGSNLTERQAVKNAVAVAGRCGIPKASSVYSVAIVMGTEVAQCNCKESGDQRTLVVGSFAILLSNT